MAVLCSVCHNATPGTEEVLAAADAPLGTQDVGPKFRWVQRHEPDV